jgi:hypothetical protein
MEAKEQLVPPIGAREDPAAEAVLPGEDTLAAAAMATKDPAVPTAHSQVAGLC